MGAVDKTTKQIQKIALEAYLKFSKVCRDNSLRFFAISGTALGVKLWKGFIPWDDDMDIAMPIDDFLRFVKIIKKHPVDNYGFTELLSIGGKFYDKRTTMIEGQYAASPDKYYGVFLDIVPLVAVPDEEDKKMAFVADVKRYIAAATGVDRAPELEPLTGESVKTVECWRDRLINTCKFGETEYCVDLSNFKGSLYLTRGFLNPIEAPFEDTTIPISSCQDEDLKVAYGKIIKDVPKKERSLNHHNFYTLCDLKKPYSSYVNSYNNEAIPEWYKEITYKNQKLCASASRELLLYKAYCLELEKQLSDYKSLAEELLDSKSYKLGNKIISPLAKVRRLIRRT